MWVRQALGGPEVRMEHALAVLVGQRPTLRVGARTDLLGRPTVAAKPNAGGPLRLRIEPVVGVAEALAERIRTELPTHDGLASAAGGVAAAARQAERVARSMKSPLSLHRLPAMFLAAALSAWEYGSTGGSFMWQR